MARPELVRMSTLAARSGVPAATIKHYVREGLLPEPARRTGRTMAYYDPRLADRVRAIKRIQREHFLPLRLIKEVLDQAGGDDDDEVIAGAIDRVLARERPPDRRTRAELLAAGVSAADLDWLERIGLVAPDQDGVYGGDDVGLLRTLGAARRAGLDPEMLPVTVLEPYLTAVRELVRAELRLYREGVLPRAGGDLAKLTEAVTVLSERLVVLMRRKMLLPTLRKMVSEAGR